MATPVHQEKKRQGSWFRGGKTGAKGSGGATTKHPPPPRQKNVSTTTSFATTTANERKDDWWQNSHVALYTIAIANSAMDDPRSKSRETEGEAQVGREGISYHIKSGEISIGFQYWFLCNRDTNVRLHSYIATCKLSYRKFPG
jgi:hypothetical protein